MLQRACSSDEASLRRYHGRGREPAGVFAEQRDQRLPEVAGGDALEVEDGDQHLEALRPARVGRQNCRREADALRPSPIRSRTRGQRTATGPMPVMISRSGRCPWRTSRWRPSSVSLSAWPLSKAATSASTACASSARAPLRKTSVSGSAKAPGWELENVSLGHGVSLLRWEKPEASSTPTIRRLTPSCRHQLSVLALRVTSRRRCSTLFGRAWQQSRRINCEETQGPAAFRTEACSPDETWAPADPVNGQAPSS